MVLGFRFPAAASIIAAAAVFVTPALAQGQLKDVLARLGQGELTASDGPGYRAIVGGEVLRLEVAGDGRATLTVTDKTGKKDSRFFSNRQLDALDAALTDAALSGATPAGCQPEAGIIVETLIEGRYRYGVECAPGPLAKAVQILRGG